MTSEQLGILNALVTYAAENIPGGLSEDERKVAQIVGAAALMGKPVGTREYNYKVINSTGYGDGFQGACDLFADMGWRVVAVISDTRPGYAHSIVLERPVEVVHPND